MTKKTLKEYLDLLTAGGFFEKTGASVGLINKNGGLFVSVFKPAVRFISEEMGGCMVDHMKIYDDAKVFLCLENTPYESKKFLCF